MELYLLLRMQAGACRTAAVSASTTAAAATASAQAGMICRRSVCFPEMCKELMEHAGRGQALLVFSPLKLRTCSRTRHGQQSPFAQLQEAGLQRLQPQRQQALDQALQAVQPAPVSELLLPGSGLQLVRWCVITGLALCIVVVCWHVCEVGVLMLLWGGRELECDEQGWLRLA